MVSKYLQYHFDGDGKLKLMKNEDKEEGEKSKEEEEKSIHWGWSSLEFTGMQGNTFFKMFSKVPATSGSPAEP